MTDLDPTNNDKFGSKILVILGTSSHAGKSIIVTALCRIFSNDGLKVSPFKAQNMSLNSYVTIDDREISMAQAIQATAARSEPIVEMNPILLKPSKENTSQIVVMGRPFKDTDIKNYYSNIDYFAKIAEDALIRLSKDNDLVVVEGAGSPAEINLYDTDIPNIFISRATKAPIILVSDIERGGVFASIYGTVKLLPEDLQEQVKGIIINKFRGDEKILEPGIKKIEELLGIPVLGVIPYLNVKIPSEDSVSIENKISGYGIEIAIIRLPRISNFTDFEPLEDGANIKYVDLTEKLGNPDAIIIPGTKNTVEDLIELKKSGLYDEIIAKRGKIPIIGICGGYQILGRSIIDKGVENSEETVEISGLGLLDVCTIFDTYDKTTRRVKKVIHGKGPILDKIKGEEVEGYEIHMGRTISKNPVFSDDGAIDKDGLTIGTYLHGLFHNESFKDAFLDYLYDKKGIKREKSKKYDQFDALASSVLKSINIDMIKRLISLDIT